MALLIKTDGTSQRVEPGNGARFTLQELQDFVGGYIERVPLNLPLDEPEPNFEMFVNEEGLILGLPHNDLASMLARQPLVGNTVVLSRAEWDQLNEGEEEAAESD